MVDKKEKLEAKKQATLDLASRMHLEARRYQAPATLDPRTLLVAAEVALEASQNERSKRAAKAGRAPKSISVDVGQRHAEIRKRAATLIAEGKAERDVAGILATQFSLSARQVRRILSATVSKKADT